MGILFGGAFGRGVGGGLTGLTLGGTLFGGLARLYGVDGASRIRGAHVAVIGLGGVGLAAVNGASIAGAGRIIAIDMVASKGNLAREFGATTPCWWRRAWTRWAPPWPPTVGAASTWPSR